MKPASLWAAFVLILAGLCLPGIARAQSSGLTIKLTRPGQGETLYSSPSSPYSGVPVMGIVTSANFDLSQIKVTLETVQGGRALHRVATTPKADGTFRFDVAINENEATNQVEEEHGCDGRCHAGLPMVLPVGPLVLRATAMDPFGDKATVERTVSVDRSGYVDVPVQVVLNGETGRGLEGVTVLADTRLLLWRARQYSGKTDATGRAIVHLERLTGTPTTYLFSIEPRVVADGMFVTGPAPVQVTIPAGAASVSPVTIAVNTRLGQINGTLAGASSPVTVHAVQVASGADHTSVATGGKFVFADLPLVKYVVTMDDGQAALQKIAAAPQTLDLGANPAGTTTLAVTAGQATRGVVRGENGQPLPFVWLADAQADRTARVDPAAGEFVAPDWPGSVRVTAPGYYARPVALGAGSLFGAPAIELTPQPETRRIPWGTGSITVPPQSLGTFAGNRLTLVRGWLWGSGSGELTVSTPDLDLSLQSGAFALEYLPGETAWLYVFRGEARLSGSDPAVAIRAGQMLAFGKGVPVPRPVPLVAPAVRALHAGETVPVPFQIDPAVPARLRDAIEALGMPAGLVGGVLGLAVVGIAAAVIVRRRPRRLR